MIEIRCSGNSYNREIDLSGSPKELRDVQQSIFNFIQDKTQQVCVIEAATVNPSPYDICLSSLSIRKSDSFIKVSISANSLQIEGEPKKLEAFADWFNFDNNLLDFHCHLDYDGNEWLVDAKSSSLIISIRS